MTKPEQQGPTRRMILRTGGAAALVTIAAGAGLGGYAWWPGTASATEPWRAAGGSFGDARLDALAFAILAPNPHNRQPWRYALVGTDRIDVTCDLQRRLPATDPFDRQITVGFGAMLELLRIAAAEKGYHTEIALFPDGEPQPRLDARRLASVRLVRDPTVVPDPLAAQMLARRSTKTAYDAARPVSDATLSALLLVGDGAALRVNGTVEPATVAALKSQTWAAWMTEWETAATRRESIDLMRIGNAEVAANPDGIELGGTMMGLGGLAGVVTREEMDRPGSTGYQQGMTMFEPILKSAQGHVWLITPDASRESQIEAGRVWLRLNLTAQQMGVAIHPLSQALQEFPEMATHYQAVHRAVGAVAGEVVQMLGRIGYAEFPQPTPRWPMRSHLVNQEA
ncbi:MAG: hypothetical protein ABL874_06180 [Sphingopyxis sp.]